jgi:signal transduction histidine kinase
MALVAAAIAVAFTGAPSGERGIAALTHGLLVAAPAGVGLAVLARRPADRFARLLVATGALWSVTALVQTSWPLTYSLARVALWLAVAANVYLLLAFPSGRLATAIEQWTFAVTVGLVGVLYLPTALVVDAYPLPVEGHTCELSCPGNAFQLTSSEPGVVDAVIRPLREAITVVIFLVAAGILVRRARLAGPMVRRALIPVAATAGFEAVAFGVYFALRGTYPDSEPLATLSWIYLLAYALIPLSFGAGLLLRRLYGAFALQAMAVRLRADSSGGDLRDAMAIALEDPSLRLTSSYAGATRDHPDPAPGREVAEFSAGGRRVVRIEHDAALVQDPDLIQAAGAYAVIVLENRRLVDELRLSVDQLSASRARIAAVADEARQRIERDLHDGAQQRLIAMSIALAREGERLRASAPEAADVLEALVDATESTIDDIRALAHGIYPSLLAERGLPDALHAAALAAPIDTSLEVDGVGRYPPEVESTVYFACLEALQNAAKHARGASHVDIMLSENGELAFAVSDDGAGFDGSRPPGSGLTNMHDRVIAVGGEVSIESEPGHGTRVAGSVPVA